MLFAEEEKRLIIYSLMFLSENTGGLTQEDYKLIANIIKKLNKELNNE